MKETKQRSVIKAVTYRLLATIATFSLAFIFTGSLEIATSIGILDFIVKFTIYYLNERAWNLTSWGYTRVKKQEATAVSDLQDHQTTIENVNTSQPASATQY